MSFRWVGQIFYSGEVFYGAGVGSQESVEAGSGQRSRAAWELVCVPLVGGHRISAVLSPSERASAGV